MLSPRAIAAFHESTRSLACGHLKFKNNAHKDMSCIYLTILVVQALLLPSHAHGDITVCANGSRAAAVYGTI